MRELTAEQLRALEVLAAQTDRSARFAGRPKRPLVISTADTWATLFSMGLIVEHPVDTFVLSEAGWAELGQRGLLVQVVSA